jgi:hypothetical protein
LSGIEEGKPARLPFLPLLQNLIIAAYEVICAMNFAAFTNL